MLVSKKKWMLSFEKERNSKLSFFAFNHIRFQLPSPSLVLSQRTLLALSILGTHLNFKTTMTKTTSINPFILRFTKNSAEPTRPPFIHKLPTEIISQILELAIELAIDPIVTPMQEQWNQINQSIVCRDWYPIRKVRNKFVLLSTRQIRIMVKMIEKGEINIEGVKELIISFVNHQSQSKTAKSDAIASIIRICPRVERLTLKLKSIYDRWLTREKSLLPYVFDDLRKLSLKSFSCRSHVDVEELVQ